MLLMGLKPCRALAVILASAAADGDVIEEVVVAVQRDRRLLRRPAGAKRDETVRDGTVDVLLIENPLSQIYSYLPPRSLLYSKYIVSPSWRYLQPIPVQVTM